MKILKAFVALVAASTLALPAGAAARQSPLGMVEGAGFYRVGEEQGPGKSKATKEMLLIRAFKGENGDSGTATQRSHTPGQGKPAAIMVQVDCVEVEEDGGTKTAYVSGEANGDRYYIQVVDEGEPGNRRDEYGFRQATFAETLTHEGRAFFFGQCGAEDVDTQTIQGGNFSVFVPPS